MHAVVVRLTINDLEADLDTLRTQIVPRVSQSPGFITGFKEEVLVDSKDPDAVTIAKTLKKSEKTIRLHRDRAFKALRAASKARSEVN